jgi:hypothetical protein
MHVGRSYRIPGFLVWTREDIYVLIAMRKRRPNDLYQEFGS